MRAALVLVAMTAAAARADVIAVHDADGSAAGATLYVDGAAGGRVPSDVTVPAGTYLVQVVKGDRVYGAWVHSGATVDVALVADADRGLARYRDAIRERAANHPRRALALLDEYTVDPRHAHDRELFEAIRMTGEIELDMFDATAAADTFMALHRMATGKLAVDALGLAAHAADLAGDDQRAESLYRQYVAKRDDDAAMWRLGVLERNHGNGTKSLERWRAKFGNKADNADRYIESFDDDDDIVKAWKSVGSPRHTRGERLAGEAALRLAEADYASWLALAITTPASTKQQAIAQNDMLVKTRDHVEARYKELDAFDVDELLGASVVRYGDVENDFGDKLTAAPVPTPVVTACNTNPQICATYRSALSRAVAKNQATAIQAWENVAKTKAASPWTVTAEERLYDHDPVKYPPPQHAPVVRLTDAP